jgi:hypothetical protein
MEKYDEFLSRLSTRARRKKLCEIPSSMVFSRFAMRFVAVECESETSLSNCSARRLIADPHLPLLEDAVLKLFPFLDVRSSP